MRDQTAGAGSAPGHAQPVAAMSVDVREQVRPHDPSVRDQLQAVVSRLIEDYSNELAVGSVIRCAARCTDAVARAQVPRDQMAGTVDRLARTCLDARMSTGSWISLTSAWRDATDARVAQPHHLHQDLM